MRILIVTLGSSGDVHPFIAVGLALRHRGHEVDMLVNPYFEGQIRDAGLSYLPLGERFDLSQIASTPELMDKRKGSAYFMNRFLLPNLPQILDAVEAALERTHPNVVLSHNLCIGVRWMCDRYGVPCVLTALSPLLWFSGQDPCLFRWWEPQRQPRWYLRFRKRLLPLFLRWTSDRPLNRIRARYGFHHEHDLLMRHAFDSMLSLGLWSSHFRDPKPDDPPNGRICGFAWYDHRADLESENEELENFLNQGDPPIVFTLGTTAVHVAGDFYQQAADACTILGRRGLLLTGQPKNEADPLPAGVRTFRYAAFSTTLSRGCATVHHGGIGTTAQAMRAGRPMVIIPFAHDQFDNAARARRLGISATVKREAVSARTLARALSSVLDDAETLERAAALGRTLTREDGAPVAAAAIEEFVTNHKS